MHSGCVHILYNGPERVFELKYLIIYLLAVAADWLQGPHIYTLYLSYGFSKHEIELLFAFGFGSSMITGTFIGILSDIRGRRLNCMFYGVFYILSCLLLHSKSFHLLLLGRVFGGIGTSILFSSFESWLICEYNQHRFDVSFLPVLFSHLSLGNCATAVISGLVAQVFADVYGLLAPFDLSAFLLVIMCVLTPLLWPENYGSQSRGLTSPFRNALRGSSKNMICLGVVQSLFESAMYSFVLQWTPVLRDAAEGIGISLPYGVIFSTFMIAVSIGSSSFTFLQEKWPCLSFLRYFLLISSLSLLLPVVFPNNIYVIYLGFIIFEMTKQNDSGKYPFNCNEYLQNTTEYVCDIHPLPRL
ncbi:unnamed protein product [Bursaphelenchus xylophilus]|uniref:(pine wood nematode) hypothetical protein n=1 Tax=Bursaphelenchus xylophilus TaxID=6326 RepID=A0A7I8WT92_BURXY|nr:unnamed protein product [Bursaphelenchus xylophilus]CAG9115914.1 unnamed protein product [Bursaphelenchus xylophilus]